MKTIIYILVNFGMYYFYIHNKS